MSPELKVDVKGPREAAFRKLVSSFRGAKVVGSSWSTEENEKLRKVMADESRELVASLREPKSRKIQEGVNLGYRILLSDIVGDFFTLRHPVNVREIKAITLDYFEHHLSISKAKILITRYGLLDGEFKTYEETGEALGLPKKAISHRLPAARDTLRRAFTASGSDLLKVKDKPQL